MHRCKHLVQLLANTDSLGAFTVTEPITVVAVLSINVRNVMTPLNVACCLQTFEEFDLFNLIGVICGLAIYNLTIVELQFPVALYKKLLKKKPTLDDLKELMPDVGRSGEE